MATSVTLQVLLETRTTHCIDYNGRGHYSNVPPLLSRPQPIPTRLRDLSHSISSELNEWERWQRRCDSFPTDNAGNSHPEDLGDVERWAELIG